jgi:hypothetical protein
MIWPSGTKVLYFVSYLVVEEKNISVKGAKGQISKETM